MAQLRSVTCHMGSHSVTCYPTQVNTPHLNPSHAGRYSIYLPRRDGRLSWPSWLDSTSAISWTCDLSITSPTLNQCNHQGSFCNEWFLCLLVWKSVIICVFVCRWVGRAVLSKSAWHLRDKTWSWRSKCWKNKKQPCKCVCVCDSLRYC